MKTEDQIRELLLAHVDEMPRTILELSRSTGISLTSARRHLSMLEEAGEIDAVEQRNNVNNKMSLHYYIGEPIVSIHSPTQVTIQRDPLVAALFGNPRCTNEQKNCVP